ncbi:MAG: hypothetical protein A2X86_14610 [Bdellovibrionales bacterium GWA2_49_15]|nr:MAG: hypothetical protein A2X86_14610 [Bdellovibrionales bacterium GWA2_49_15]HAZ13428.1 hypothetical protein [Bdellovibrionales bacterium]
MQTEITLKRWTKYFAVMTASLGLVGILGWKYGCLFLSSLKSSCIPMAPLTAVLFMLSGPLLYAFTLERLPKSARVSAILVSTLIGFIGLMITMSFIFHLNFPLEFHLFPSNEQFGDVPANRMSPVTALGFLLAGLAFLFLIYAREKRLFSKTLTTLGAAIMILGLAFGLSYLRPVPFLYGTAIIPMALPTVLAFCCLGLGFIMTAGPDSYLLRPMVGMNVRARLLRIAVPLATTIGIIHVCLNAIPALGFEEVQKAVWVDLLFIPVMVICVFFVAKWIGGILDQEVALRQEVETELKRYAEEIIDAQETERLRIAKEIHEGVIQDLGVIVHLLRDSSRTNPSVSPMVGSLMTAIDEVRRITHNLRPSILDDLGLAISLRSLCDDLQARTKIEIDQNIAENLSRFAAPLELAIFRIAQEALSNIEKHSGATKVRLNYFLRGLELQLEIIDNGIGFCQKTEEHARRIMKLRSGLGLQHIKERATAIGGRVSVETLPGQGTKIVVGVSIMAPEQKGASEDARSYSGILS